MKILVTGATGFIGSHLCQRLVADGHQVWSLARSPQKAEQFGVPGAILPYALSTVIGSPNPWVEQLPDDLDAVVHSAGLTSSFRARDFFAVNRDATRQLATDLAARFSRLRFVLVSSLAAAGPSPTPMDEQAAPRPVSRYGQSKWEAEQALAAAAPASWKQIVLRPSMVFGPRDPAALELFKMARLRLFAIPGLTGCWKRYSFVGIEDMVELLTLALRCDMPEPRRVYFAAHPRVIRFGELATALGNSLNRRWMLKIPVPDLLAPVAAWGAKCIWAVGLKPPSLTPDKCREARQRSWLCSGGRSERELGMSYLWDLQATLNAAAADYRSRGWL